MMKTIGEWVANKVMWLVLGGVLLFSMPVHAEVLAEMPVTGDVTALQATPVNGGVSYRGELLQGGLLRGTVAPGTQLQLNGREVAVAEDGTFVCGFGRDEPLRQVLDLVTPQGDKQQVVWMLGARNYDIQKVTGIPQRIMSPNQKDLDRINEELALTTAARKVFSSSKDFNVEFIWPAKGPISGVYGSQRYYNGEAGRPHFGLDIAAPRGAPVLAPAGGQITLAHKDMFYSGGTVILDHGMGLSSTFIHMDEVLVEQGQRVEQGDQIGRVGASGRATGPHLDWRMNWFEVRLDPQILMQGIPMPKTVE
jgi:hypothetical protein